MKRSNEDIGKNNEIKASITEPNRIRKRNSAIQRKRKREALSRPATSPQRVTIRTGAKREEEGIRGIEGQFGLA